MDQVSFFNAQNEQKTAYELSAGEFGLLLRNLRIFGNLASVAIIASNDRKSHQKPRVQPVKEAIELLHEVLGDQNAEDAHITLSGLDVLREDRAEVALASQYPSKSEFYKKKGSVVLGLATMATSMNMLRSPLMENSHWLIEPDAMSDMFDQFHQEGVERISAQV